MKGCPSISIVIPTHKRAVLLEKSLWSVIKQSTLPLEVIVVDDANCEETRKCIENLSIDYIVYVSNNSKGASSSRNLGVQIAKGTFIAFLDDDDEFKENKIEELVKVLDDLPDIDLIYHKAEIHLINERLSYLTSPTLSFKGEILANILVQNQIGGTPMVAIRKSRFQEIGSFDESLPALEDYELWIRASKNNLSFYGIDKALTRCNYRTGERSVSKDVEANLKAFAIIEERYNEEYKKITPEQIKLHEAWKKRIIVHKHLLAGNLRLALMAQFELLKIYPSLLNLASLVVMLLGPKIVFKLRAMQRNK